MLVVILYTLMTGLGPSVVRATLMLLFVLAGKLIDRDTHSVSLLSLVAVLMLIYNPAYINDVSFQLSFLVTLGLLTMADVIARKFNNVPNWIKVPVLIPIVAQVWVAPIQMFYFNTFSLYSVFANIATVSLLSVISFCGFVGSVLAVIPQIADLSCMIFDFVLNYLLTALVYISNFFAGLKYSLVQTTHPNIIQLVLYYFMLGVVTVLIKDEKYKKAFYVLLGVSLVLICTTIKPVSKDLEVIAFDVGNADSFLIKTPENKYFMIDTGKAPYGSGNSQAKIIMLKYLKDRGIKDIFIACVDGLNGFENAITSVFPNTIIQRCIIHIVRNSVKFVSYKDLKKVCSDLKSIYQANSEEEALYNLDLFKDKWDSKYSYIYKIWKNSWNSIRPMFDYSKEIRRMIYTTNTIESFNNGIKRITKTKGSFRSDTSLLKLLYLVTQDLTKKWIMPIKDWSSIFTELNIMFEDRMSCFLEYNKYTESKDG
jgi:ComEC/Rec2-related protein